MSSFMAQLGSLKKAEKEVQHVQHHVIRAWPSDGAGYGMAQSVHSCS